MAQQLPARRHRPLARDTRGAVLVEFALAAPILLMILMGIIGYGGYFWRAHALQQAANDGARAALGGLTAAERASIARDTIRSDLAALGSIAPARVAIQVAERSGTIDVAIAYDGSAEPFLALGLVPLPDPVIRREASVRLGGL
ncbi:TadE/TadG family type IV pilus assembly protein [Sphingomonas sp. 1P06PA]|uniref:TadE/TadG family type IV pilus assembly protein n=1 Tax=Sphingomonas sp. 1P06PA TaxID=554121 RepID=UPI0039A6158C